MAPELLALKEVKQTGNIFCIASGGCTAFSFLSTQPQGVLACDINPAQIALVALKTSVLALPDQDAIRNAFLKSARDAYPQISSGLPEWVRDFWQAQLSSLENGLNKCGVIDRKLALVMRIFYRLVHSRTVTAQMLRFHSLEEQREFYQKVWRTGRWKACFRYLLNLRLLSLIYGQEAVKSLPSDFGRQIERQVEEALTHFASEQNPCLWQTFMPDVYPPTSTLLPGYLQPTALENLQTALPRLTLRTGDAVQVMKEGHQAFDFFSLTNILERVEPAYAGLLAESVHSSANPGALVFLRFIFAPTAELLHPFHDRFKLQSALMERCNQSDRGLFCRNSWVFRKEG